MQSSSAPQLLTIQALRGIAALLVLFLHISGMQAGIIASDADTEVLNGFWTRGYAGVDLFFVISGFIMVYVTMTTNHSPQAARKFIAARFIRIYPLWWFYAGLMALIFLAIYGVGADPETAQKSGGAGLYLLRSFALIPQAQNPVVPVGWTLIHEVYFYLIFTAFIVLPRKYLPALLTVWAVQILVSFGIGIRVGATKNLSALVNSPLTIEFIGGALAAVMVANKNYKLPKMFLILGSVAFVTSMFFYNNGETFYGNWARVLLFGVPAIFIVYGLVSIERTQPIKVPKALVSLGDWSYSLYLGHLIVLLCLKNVWELINAWGVALSVPDQLLGVFRLGSPGFVDNLIFALAAVFACVLASALSYKFVERPVISALRKRKTVVPAQS